MVHDGADVPEGPINFDVVRVTFDEERLISDAGLLLTASLADRLGIEELVNESVWLDPKLPGACLPCPALRHLQSSSLRNQQSDRGWEQAVGGLGVPVSDRLLLDRDLRRESRRGALAAIACRARPDGDRRRRARGR